MMIKMVVKMVREETCWPQCLALVVVLGLVVGCSAPGATIILTPTPTTSPTTTPQPNSSPEPPPTPTPEEPTVAPPSGLIYRTIDGLWRIEADAIAALLTDRVDVILSPDALRGTGATQALFVRDISETSDTDIWIIDLDTGQERNLTREANRIECCPQWWPGGPPDVIIFGSWPRNAELGPSTGFLSALAVDDSWYLVLDEQSQSNALPAPAADGGTIAWDRAGAAWLYRWGAELEPFDGGFWAISREERADCQPSLVSGREAVGLGSGR